MRAQALPSRWYSRLANHLVAPRVTGVRPAVPIWHQHLQRNGWHPDRRRGFHTEERAIPTTDRADAPPIEYTESASTIDDGLLLNGREELPPIDLEDSLPLDRAGPLPVLDALPWSCPGCGAYTQLQDADAAGFYSHTRKPVKAFIVARSTQFAKKDAVDPPEADKHSDKPTTAPAASLTPVCDRCHNLTHHSRGVSIVHPTLPAVQAIFEETPYSYNHVYHVLDAADFPMSLIPRLHEWLDLSPQRSQNRRATHKKYQHGRRAEMSFIITRSDLLAPKKEQVDTMMPVLLRILRQALGRAGRDVRLGNVRLVSSRRGWWTNEIKEAIWDRGGGGWMVGKVNVGKSSLFENILPKGRIHTRDLLKMGSAQKAFEHSSGAAKWPEGHDKPEDAFPSYSEEWTSDSLLPPKPPDVEYPVLPVVSELPGTTASPIRVPFGKGKGELIDLPGLNRGGLDELVLDEHKSGLVMRNRVKAKQVVIQPWQSLVISNIIRITPVTPDITYLACPFLPPDIEYHVCHTDKAKEMLAQTRDHVIKGIAKPEVADTIQSAGTYQLGGDITLQRAGPLTRRDAVGLSPGRLPFMVFGLDLLLESIGWIEISAQVRRKAFEQADLDPASEKSVRFPEIEVFSPNGEHIAERETLNAWLLGGQRKPAKSQRRQRPPQSMKGVKKENKRQKREDRARDTSTSSV